MSDRTWMIVNFAFDLLLFQYFLARFFVMEELTLIQPSEFRSLIWIFLIFHLLNVYRVYDYFRGNQTGIGSKAMYRFRMCIIFIFGLVLLLLTLTMLKMKLTFTMSFFMLILAHLVMVSYIVLTYIYRSIVLRAEDEMESIRNAKEIDRFEQLRKGLQRPHMTTEQLI